jgi:hypothetical protein
MFFNFAMFLSEVLIGIKPPDPRGLLFGIGGIDDPMPGEVDDG